MIRARLGWLRGWPARDGAADEIPWTSISGAGEASALRVDRTRLQHATHQLNALPAQFPRALPGVVGDLQRWRAGIATRLEALKQAIHRGKPLPACAALLDTPQLLRRGCRLRAPQRAELLRGLSGPLFPIQRALIWLHWQDGPGLLASVRFVRTHSRAWEALLLHDPEGLQLCLRLCVQASREPRCLEPVLDLLAKPLAWQVVLERPEAQRAWLAGLAKQLKKPDPPQAAPPAKPAPDLAGPLVAACRSLLELEPDARAVAFRLFGRALPDTELSEAQRWWERVEAAGREAARLRSADAANRPRWLALQTEVQHLRESRNPLARDEQPQHVAACCSKLARHAGRKLLVRMLSVLTCLEDAAELWRGLLIDWSGEFCEDRPDPSRCLETCSSLKRLLPIWVPAELVGVARRKALRRALRLSEQLSGLFVGEALPARESKGITVVLAQLGPPENPAAGWNTYNRLSCLRSLVRELGPDQVVGLARCLPPDSPFFSCAADWQRGLARLLASGQEPAHAARALTRSAKQLAELAWESSSAAVFLGWARDAATAPLLRRSLACGVLPELRSLLRLACLVRDARCPGRIPRPTQLEPLLVDPNWQAACPAALHGLLGRLRAVAPSRAQTLAARLFRHGTKLQEEIAALEERVEQALEPRRSHMHQRLTRLRARVGKPAALRPGQVGKAARRLELASAEEELRRWLSATEVWADRQLRARLGEALIKDWQRDPALQHVLACLLQLEPHFCKLGLRLLRLREGPRPWDLRDAPANAAFLQRLERQGVNTQPWLDGWGRRTLAWQGQMLTLALEDDPLEVLRMGAPFKTCLAPGSFNFFASVANAADINKRVLYARVTPGGAVIGRCLLALTEQGNLLSYHPYAHDPALDFPGLVKLQMTALADAMQSAVVAGGSVSLLLARDWYDDGAVDLLERYACLRAGSDFRKSLARLPPEDLLARLQSLLAEQRLRVWSLHRVLKLPELEQRPELARVLLPLCQLHNLPHRARVRAAQLARLAGEHRVARALLRKSDSEKLDQDGQAALARELCESGLPQRALAVLRRTRGRGLRRWLDEPPLRLEAAALAMRGLHRRRRAAALFKAAIAGAGWRKDLVQRCRRQLQDLEDA